MNIYDVRWEQKT